jgi:hypothetical protein
MDAMRFHRHIIAPSIVALLVATLLWSGLAWLDIPPIYRLARGHYPFFFYQGHLLIVSAALLAWFHGAAAHGIVWIAQKLHRVASAVMVMGFLAIDGGMHLFSIPHIEGWWLPVVSGGAFLTALTAWVQRTRNK